MPRSLYLLDGHAQIYRAYYAPFRDLSSPSGEPTRATYVFMSSLFNLLQSRKPDYLAMVVDGESSTRSRRRIYAEYKANRSPPPDDFPPQVDRILAILELMEIPVLAAEGFEGDDILATLVHQLRGHDLDIYLVSKDKDLEQLIGERVKLYDLGSQTEIDAETLAQKKGYRPNQAVEIQTLAGDPVDNIPGIRGVGIKTAAKLVQQYGTAEAVLANAGHLKPGLRANVEAFADQLPVTRELVTLKADVPVEFDLQQARFEGVPADRLRPVFEELGLRRLLGTLDRLAADSSAVESSAQMPAKAPPRAEDKRNDVLVDTLDQLHWLAEQLRAQKIFALDTETTGLHPIDSKLVGISVCWKAAEAYYIPVRAAVGDTLSVEEVTKALAAILADPKIAKCGHNAKFDLMVLNELGLDVGGLVFDTMIASFLLNPLRPSHSLDALALEFFGTELIPITDLIGKGSRQGTLDELDARQVCPYACQDAEATWRLYEVLQAELENSAVKKLFEETEIPLVDVLVQMERNGVAIDVDSLSEMSTRFAERLAALTREIHRAAGHPFNIDSPKQLAEVLYDEAGLRVVRKTKTGRSTDAESLSQLALETSNPLPGFVLEYRELSKLKSTYVDSLPAMRSSKTGRIHARFNMIGAVTGRLSSSDPNLQNIPVRTELGRQIRKAFVASRPGTVLMIADYSQIELRLLAHYCQDAALLLAFDQDQDIHRFVASEVFGVRLAEVTAQQRSRAKAVNFGIIYGQTAYGLSRSISMTVGEAQRFIDMYFLRYPGIRLFVDDCIARATREGYASTILGRRRPIPQLQARSRPQRALGERLAVNTVLQGSAADLIKRAMIHIHRRLKAHPDGPRMLIQVHDELVFEVPQDQIEAEAGRVREEMSTAIELRVPLKVDVRWGANWLDTKES